MYFDIFNRFGVTYECDRQTDRRRERDILIAKAALHRVARSKKTGPTDIHTNAISVLGTYYVSRKKRPNCFLVIFSTQLGRFWWNLVHRFLN